MYDFQLLCECNLDFGKCKTGIPIIVWRYLDNIRNALDISSDRESSHYIIASDCEYAKSENIVIVYTFEPGNGIKYHICYEKGE